MTWLSPNELRVGLGVMRLSTEPTRDETHARTIVHTALDEGLRVFDTAHAYALDETELGHNERWLGRFLTEHPLGHEARVITKGGMRRHGARWIPDGKAATLERHCAASLAALGRPIDLYLLHAPDGKTPLSTSVRALASLKERGLVKHIGLSNVTRPQLEEALTLTDLAAVQLGLSVIDDSTIRGGVVALALQRGLTVLCHSPLGGPKKFAQLGRNATLVKAAEANRCTPWEWALASLLALSPQVMVLPGARRIETVKSSRRAADLTYTHSPPPEPPPTSTTTNQRVLLLMGVQGSGKTSAVERAVQDGLTRLNRDDAGGTLDALHARIGPLLTQGKSVVLDNTYVTRAQRSGALTAATKHGIPVHGVWHDIDTEQAQVNIVLRMLEKHARLLTPAELHKGRTPDSLSPRGFQSTVRVVEPLGDDEGFASLTHVPFVRKPWPWVQNTPALFLGLETAADARPSEVPVIVVGWKEGGVTLPDGILNAVCPHPAGPPTCWCRPPFPGLVLFHARSLGVSLGGSVFRTSTPALQKLARTLGIPLG